MGMKKSICNTVLWGINKLECAKCLEHSSAYRKHWKDLLHYYFWSRESHEESCVFRLFLWPKLSWSRREVREVLGPPFTWDGKGVKGRKRGAGWQVLREPSSTPLPMSRLFLELDGGELTQKPFILCACCGLTPNSSRRGMEMGPRKKSSLNPALSARLNSLAQNLPSWLQGLIHTGS